MVNNCVLQDLFTFYVSQLPADGKQKLQVNAFKIVTSVTTGSLFSCTDCQHCKLWTTSSSKSHQNCDI